MHHSQYASSTEYWTIFEDSQNSASAKRSLIDHRVPAFSPQLMIPHNFRNN